MAGRKSGYIKIRPVVDSDDSGSKKEANKIIIQGQKKTLTTNQALLAVVIAVLVFVLFRYSYKLNLDLSAIIAFLFLVIGVFVLSSVVFLENYERAVVQRAGRFTKVAGPGWTFIIPGLETYNVVDVRVKAHSLLFHCLGVLYLPVYRDSGDFRIVEL